ncbi:hypothetical protein M378DRAFT_168232 [Amanita muscaria Koide BX008]|uniref:FAD-binding PCMH-type domain-containing protein n=1 Tax=Amanita muscaria (strain Koide BX008) TaxID=946122 RepID=A0A0C2SBV0_AMAMK|nr:hypothetical protein M378DRAFT_168232 [Amanita muscaria Koide BX008]
MKARWLLPSLAVTVVSLSPLASAAPSCKCLSSQPCWPSASDFSQLASQVSLPLIKPTPPASVCYPPLSPNAPECLAVEAHLHDNPWRTNLPGAMLSTNFETFTFDNGTIDACYYNILLGVPCHQGSIPIIGVDARSVSDIQAAVNFAAKHYLRLVVKNTGHDYLGRSIARGAFMLWTHNLKDIAYDDAFVPSGAPGHSQTFKALTVGAGVQWNEAYAAADAHGRAIVGGSCPSVGTTGGWIQGGGHSGLSPVHGLGADNAIEFKVVLANGQYVTANQYQNSDLFWALRGGGGGTYGVVVCVTYNTFDVAPTTSIRLDAVFATPAIALKAITELITILPTLQDAGFGGHYLVSHAGIVSANFASNAALAKVNDAYSAFIERLGAAGAVVTVVKASAPSYYAASAPILAADNLLGGVETELISRFLSRTAATQAPAAVAQTILGITQGVEIMAVAGGAVSKVDPDSAGVTPAWRQAIAIIESSIIWPEGTPTAQINQLRQGAAAELAALDPLSPNHGTYLNEASQYEKDFRGTFFGSHYQRLAAIKKQYDEDDLFLVTEGVGSENWDKTLNCRV